MNITDFENLQDAIHYINNRAREDKYSDIDVCGSIELLNKKTNKIRTAYVLDRDYFDLGINDPLIFKKGDPKLEQIIDRTLRMYEDSNID